MKYTTAPNGTKAKYPAIGKGQDPNTMSITDEQGGLKVDPSVRLDELRGEPPGCVPMERTMAKPQAYIAKKGTP